MISLTKFNLCINWLTEIDDSNSNEAMCNLMLNHVNSMIFQQNYLFWMICYNTQAAYWGTTSQENLIIASHQMSYLMNPHWPHRSFLQQLQHLWQNADIQELHKNQQDLNKQIHNKFKYIYQTEGQSIYDEYQQVKRNINHILKEKEWALKVQLQTDYDTAALMQDMIVQLTVNNTILFLIQPHLISVEYGFKKHTHIAQTFFDSSLFVKCDENLNWQIFIVDDLISLCTH